MSIVNDHRDRKRDSMMICEDLTANAKNATIIKNQSRKAIKGDIEALKEHWIYDAVQLPNDGAVAIQRIGQPLERLERTPDWLNGHEAKVLKESCELTLFIKEWESSAHKHLGASVVYPDEVKFRLENPLKVINMPPHKKETLQHRWSREDSLSSFEPSLVAAALRSWD